MNKLMCLSVILAITSITIGADLNVPDQYTTIQSAIEAAVDGDTIVVAPGLYRENVNFLGKAVTLQSEDPTNWETVRATTIYTSYTGSCVTFANNEGPQSVIEGFTIARGKGTYNWSVGVVGGGIYCNNSSPTIRYCNIIKNGNENTNNGAGVALVGGSNALIMNCFITNNKTQGAGSAVFVHLSQPSFVNCTIADNVSFTYRCQVYYREADPVMTGCIVWGNSGGILCQQTESLEGISNCCIERVENEAYTFYDHLTSGGNISEKPRFVSPVSDIDSSEFGDYHLQHDSQCINMGDPAFDSDGTDIDGHRRTIAGRIDIGADEVTPLIKMLSPSVDDVWATNSTHQIRWQSYVYQGNIDIEISVDSGSSWQTIASEITDTGSFNWVVPDTIDSDQCIVKVTATQYDYTIDYIDSGVFSIQAGDIDLPVDSPWPSLGGKFDRDGQSLLSGPELGCKKWSFETDGQINQSMAIGANNNVHIPSENGLLYTVSSDGSLIWSFDAESKITSSPSVGLDGSVYFGCDNGKIYALDKDGDVRWNYSTDAMVFSSPAVDSQGNVFIGSQDGTLTALSASGGKLWQLNLPIEQRRYAQVYGEPVLVAEGVSGSALEFDGIDDSVLLDNDNTINRIFTVSAWVKTTASSGAIVASDYSISASKWCLKVSGAGTLKFEIQQCVAGGTTPINDDNWHHVAVQCWHDQNNDLQINLYVDGQRDAKSYWSCESGSGIAGQKIVIGSCDGQQHFAGTIDEVRIYEHMLTASQIENPESLNRQASCYMPFDNIDDEQTVSIYKTKLGNSILASPTVGPDGTVYTGGLYEPTLYALNPADGSIKWTAAFPTGSGFFVSPVIADNGTIYVSLVDSPELYVVDPDTGQILQSIDLFEIPDSNDFLVAHFPFDQDGSDIAGSNHAVLHSTASISDDSTVGEGSLSLDGEDAYVSADSICDQIAGGDFTLSFWIKSDDASGNPYIAEFNTEMGGSILRLGLGGQFLEILDVVRDEATDQPITWQFHDTDIPVFDGQWHEVVFCLNDFGDTATLYIDGQHAIQFTTPVSIKSSYTFSMGKRLNGLVDDVKIYNKALTDEMLVSEPTNQCLTEPAIASDGTVYVSLSDPYLRAFNPDGSSKWITRLGVQGGFTLSVGNDGLIYAASDDNTLYVVSPEGDLLSVFNGDKHLCFPVVASDGTIYVSDSDNTAWAISADPCAENVFDLHRIEDISGDGIVNFVDFSLYVSDWMHAGENIIETEYLTGDIDRNLQVNFNDLLAIAQNWLNIN